MSDGVCLYCGGKVDADVVACRSCNRALDVVLPTQASAPAPAAPVPARAPRAKEGVGPATALLIGISCLLGMGSVLGSVAYCILALLGSDSTPGGSAFAHVLAVMAMGPGLFILSGLLGFSRPRLAGKLLVGGSVAASLWYVFAVQGHGLFGDAEWKWVPFLATFAPMLILGIALLGLALIKTQPSLDADIRSRAGVAAVVVVVILLMADGGIAWRMADSGYYSPPPPGAYAAPMAVPAEDKAPPAALDRVSEVGGRGGGPFHDVGPRGGLLVGLHVTISWFNGHEIIKSIVPLYRVGDATVKGSLHGQSSGREQETIAGPGYAIGRLVAQGTDRVNGFKAVFMRITANGLDPEDRLEGNWVGGRGAGPEVYLGEDGIPVVGISGREGDDVDALGLVADPDATAEDSLAWVNAEGFIQRWLYLGALPLGDLAADHNAALDKRWIPGLEGMKPTQHDRISLGGIEYRWRVGNVGDYFLPLGSVENSVSIVLAYVVSDRDVAAATLLTGSDDSAVWFLDGQEVQRYIGARGVGKDQERTAKPVALRKGMNLLVGLVINGSGPTAACSRFVDPAGRPLLLRAGPTLKEPRAGAEPSKSAPLGPDVGLVGHWTLDEPSGSTAADASGKGIQGTLVGAPEWSAGRIGGGLSLDGSGAFVDLGTPALPAGRSPRTLSVWGKTRTTEGGYRWIAAWGTPSQNQAMFIGMFGSDLVGGGFGGSGADVTVAGYWETTRWHHLALTYDGAAARLYADGVERASASKGWTLTPGRAFIGKQINGNEYWNGWIDDVRIYNRVLSSEEIRALAAGD